MFVPIETAIQNAIDIGAFNVGILLGVLIMHLVNMVTMRNMQKQCAEFMEELFDQLNETRNPETITDEKG